MEPRFRGGKVDPRPQLRPHPRDQPQEAGRAAADVRRPGDLRPDRRGRPHLVLGLADLAPDAAGAAARSSSPTARPSTSRATTRSATSRSSGSRPARRSTSSAGRSPKATILSGPPRGAAHDGSAARLHRRADRRCDVARHSRRRPVRAERRQPPAVASRRRQGRGGSPPAGRSDDVGLARVPRRRTAVATHAIRLRSLDRRAAPLPTPNPLLDDIEQVPVVLAVAADLNNIALMDGDIARPPPITGGASIYPFCWSILLAAHARGLGGVMTTFLSRAETQARADPWPARRSCPCRHDLPRPTGAPEHEAAPRTGCRTSRPSIDSTENR